MEFNEAATLTKHGFNLKHVYDVTTEMILDLKHLMVTWK